MARRWRSPVGEIDIVARRRGVLVFVEVKARERLDDAAEAVIVRQQRRIIAAAEAWLARHPDDVNANIRFDVVLVAPKSLPRHIQGGVRRERLDSLHWSHFLRRTGVHFAGKCSKQAVYS